MFDRSKIDYLCCRLIIIAIIICNIDAGETPPKYCQLPATFPRLQHCQQHPPVLRARQHSTHQTQPPRHQGSARSHQITRTLRSRTVDVAHPLSQVSQLQRIPLLLTPQVHLADSATTPPGSSALSPNIPNLCSRATASTCPKSILAQFQSMTLSMQAVSF